MARLLIIRGAQLGIEYRLDAETVIGRSSTATIQLLDPSVSRQHARIVRDGDVYALENLSRTAVTLHNGLPVGGRATLVPGDDLSIGSYGLVFEPELALIRARYDDGYVVISPHRPDPLPPAPSEGALGDAANAALIAILETCLREDDVAAALAGTLGRVVAHFGMARGFVLRFAGKRHQLLATHGDGPMVVSRTVLARVQRERDVIVCRDATSDVQLGAGLSVAQGTARTILCAPLVAGGAVVGLIQVDSTRPTDALPQDARAFLERLAVLGRVLLRLRSGAVPVVQTRTAPPMIAAAPAMTRLLADVDQAAATGATCLIFGETGAGKEVIARRIHDGSDRRHGPFIAVNCAAIPEALIESELFGYEKGAFTGAAKATPGKVELADGGTLFLDEIGDMSPFAQAKLLRFLQERVFYRVGAKRDTRVDVRVIAATNRDLKARIAEGSFREDLYFRLAVIPLPVPPLRARPEDVPALADAFLARFCAELKRPPMTLSADARHRMAAYRWPGNVRELMNLMERCAVLGREVLPLSESQAAPGSSPTEAAGEPAEDEATRVAAALRQHRGNKSQAAKTLGVSRPTLNKLIKRHGVDIYR